MAVQSILDLLSNLRNLDVRIWADAGQLRASAPDGVLTPELRAQLSARKTEILAFLQQASQVSHKTPEIQRIVRDGLIPLSFSQQRIWLFDQLEPQNPAYNIPASVRLTGPLNVIALQASINEIVRRHEVLRTTFNTVNGVPSQIIAAELTLFIPQTDLRDLPFPEREAAARQAVNEEAKRPFDLVRDPLVRAALLRLADEEYVLLFTIHHAVSDDWSMGVFVRELVICYQAFITRQPVPLPDLPIQYADYAVWQRSDAQRDVLQSQLAFWKQRLSVLNEQPVIPTDRPRLATQTYHGARRFRMFPEALVEQLKILSQKEESTLFMLILAGINILLHQYMGGSRVVVGSPVAGRSKREIEELIGFFVNTVVLTTDMTGDLSFSTLLARVREVTTSAYSHQDVPFEQVLDALRSKDEQNQTGLFQVFFNMLNAASQQVDIPGLQIKPFSDFIVGAPDVGAKFDLTFVAVEHPRGLQVDISYNIDLFEATTIDWLLEHLQTILTSAAANPNLPLSAFPSLPVLTAPRAEPTQPFILFPFDEIEQSLHGRFEKQVQQYATRPAIVHNGETLSYDQLNRFANRLARAILQVSPEQHTAQSVSLLLGHDAQAIAGMLAALKACKIFVTLDPAYPQERLTDMLDDSQACLIVTNSLHLPLAENLRKGIKREIGMINIDQLAPSLADTNLSLVIDPGQVAYIVYTSGSMGRPKGVTQSHRNVLHFIRNYTNGLHLAADDRLSLIPSFSFSAAMMDVFGALLNGASLYPFDVTSDGLDKLGEWLIENEISVYHSVPTIFRHFTAALKEDVIFPHVRLIDFGGEPVSRQHIRLYRKHFTENCLLVNGLGATELNVIRQFVLDHNTDFIGDSVPVGYEVPDTCIFLLDEHGNEVGYNQPGEIVIESRYLSPGYWQQPEQTQAAFKMMPDGQRRYYTGDLGRLRPDGCLEHYGRKDLQVKIRGVRIEPAEIEAALLEQAAVKEAVVIAENNPAGEKVLIAYLVAKDPDVMLSADTLGNALLEKLPSSMLPSEFVWVKAMPLTTTGKIDRRALPSAARVGSIAVEEPTALADTSAQAAPRTPTEISLAKMWAEVLRLEKVGIYERFSELGGDSLIAAQLVARSRSLFQVALPFRVLFRMQTIAEVAKYLDEAHLAQSLKSQMVQTVDAETAYGEVPFTQSQKRFIDLRFPSPHWWNISYIFKLDRALANPAIFEQAIQHVFTHHDALRMRFTIDDSGWKQFIAPPDVAQKSVLSTVDLSDKPLKEREIAMMEMAAQLQKSLNLTDGPLMRVVLFNLGESKPCHLLIIMHHMVTDSVSYLITVQDIITACQQISQGMPVQLPPKTTSFKEWSEKMHAYVQSAEFKREQDFYLALPWDQAGPLPLDFPDGREKNAISSHELSLMSLNPQETEMLLKELPRQHSVQPFEAILAALTLSITNWTGRSSMILNTINLGRMIEIPGGDDVDLSRTVGWLATHYLLLLKRETDDPFEALKSIQEQLRQLPGSGYSDDIARLSPTYSAAQSLPAYVNDLRLNYTGQGGPPASDVLRSTSLSAGTTSDPAGREDYLLGCVATVMGKRLYLAWDYSLNCYEKETIARVTQDFIANLRSILDHCKVTTN